MREIGQRVGAISHTIEETVYLFGFGVYEGDHVPPDGIGFGFPNPRIKLDNGKTVYGCECWWGSEEKIKFIIGERKVIDVDMDQARKDASRAEVKL